MADSEAPGEEVWRCMHKAVVRRNDVYRWVIALRQLEKVPGFFRHVHIIRSRTHRLESEYKELLDKCLAVECRYGRELAALGCEREFNGLMDIVARLRICQKSVWDAFAQTLPDYQVVSEIIGEIAAIVCARKGCQARIVGGYPSALSSARRVVTNFLTTSAVWDKVESVAGFRRYVREACVPLTYSSWVADENGLDERATQNVFRKWTFESDFQDKHGRRPTPTEVRDGVRLIGGRSPQTFDQMLFAEATLREVELPPSLMSDRNAGTHEERESNVFQLPDGTLVDDIPVERRIARDKLRAMGAENQDRLERWMTANNGLLVDLTSVPPPTAIAEKIGVTAQEAECLSRLIGELAEFSALPREKPGSSHRVNPVRADGGHPASRA